MADFGNRELRNDAGRKGNMKIQPIATLEERMVRYQRDVRKFWLSDFSPMVATGAVVVYGTMYGLTQVLTVQLIADWRLIATATWLVALIPPLKMLYPTKPLQSDVDADKALRRACGMDDRTSDEVKDHNC